MCKGINLQVEEEETSVQLLSLQENPEKMFSVGVFEVETLRRVSTKFKQR